MRLWVGLLLLVGCKASEASVAEGRDIFAANCARCHGTEGTGGVALWEGGPAPRNLRDTSFLKSTSDAQLRQTILHGKPPGMPAFDKVLTGPQVETLIAHLRNEKKP